MTTTVNIQISDDAVKMLMMAAVVLGIGYMVYKVLEETPPAEIPLPKEAKDFSELPEVSPETIEELGFHEDVNRRSVPLLENGNYVEAVREASVALYDVIRKKSGVQDDATNLVRKVFRGANRVLKFVNIAPEHIQNAEDGLVHYLDAFSKHTRKIQMHATVNLSKKEAFLYVNMAGFLAEQVEEKTVRVSVQASS